MKGLFKKRKESKKAIKEPVLALLPPEKGTRTIQYVSEEGLIVPANTYMYEVFSPMDRCPICNRTFLVNRLDVHIRVCKNQCGGGRRLMFDSKRQRTRHIQPTFLDELPKDEEFWNEIKRQRRERRKKWLREGEIARKERRKLLIKTAVNAMTSYKKPRKPKARLQRRITKVSKINQSKRKFRGRMAKKRHGIIKGVIEKLKRFFSFKNKSTSRSKAPKKNVTRYIIRKFSPKSRNPLYGHAPQKPRSKLKHPSLRRYKTAIGATRGYKRSQQSSIKPKQRLQRSIKKMTKSRRPLQEMTPKKRFGIFGRTIKKLKKLFSFRKKEVDPKRIKPSDKNVQRYVIMQLKPKKQKTLKSRRKLRSGFMMPMLQKLLAPSKNETKVPKKKGLPNVKGKEKFQLQSQEKDQEKVQSQFSKGTGKKKKSKTSKRPVKRSYPRKRTTRKGERRRKKR